MTNFSGIFGSTDCVIKIFVCESDADRAVNDEKAEREFNFITRLYVGGFPSPMAFRREGNVIAMTFIGNLKKRAKRLNELNFNDFDAQKAYFDICELITKMYQDAKIVHSKLSSEHILWCDQKFWIINLSSAVDYNDSSAKINLKRDCYRITKFFQEQNVAVIDSEKLFSSIIRPTAKNPSKKADKQIHQY